MDTASSQAQEHHHETTTCVSSIPCFEISDSDNLKAPAAPLVPNILTCTEQPHTPQSSSGSGTPETDTSFLDSLLLPTSSPKPFKKRNHVRNRDSSLCQSTSSSTVNTPNYTPLTQSNNEDELLHDVLPVQLGDEDNEKDEEMIEKDDEERNLRFYQSISTSAVNNNEDDVVVVHHDESPVPGGEQDKSFVKANKMSSAFPATMARTCNS